MYSVLFVDDEEIARKGISTIIDWQKYGFIFLGTAQNGLEAYEIIRKQRPNVVITDLKMPGLDGIGLISRVRNEFPEIIFVILSGYSEFNLAREAMRYGVRHYLLKPCNQEKIIEVLIEIRQDILHNYEKKSIPADFSSIKIKNKLVKKIIDCIQLQLDNENLSLKWLAREYLHMDDNYLSRLFTKEMGEHFSRYLTRLRMEKAKELIDQNEADCIYEIARKVGFGNNPQYFSHLFKKFTGYTPTEYKKRPR
ncbi:MAG: response regulator [Firmicutes bacterium]|nr:response regulator [Bacillota bacterium]